MLIHVHTYIFTSVSACKFWFNHHLDIRPNPSNFESNVFICAFINEASDLNKPKEKQLWLFITEGKETRKQHLTTISPVHELWKKHMTIESIVLMRNMTPLFWKHCFLDEEPKPWKEQRGRGFTWQHPADELEVNRYCCHTAVCFYTSTNVPLTFICAFILFSNNSTHNCSLPPALSLRWHCSKTPLYCFIFSFKFLSEIARPPGLFLCSLLRGTLIKLKATVRVLASILSVYEHRSAQKHSQFMTFAEFSTQINELQYISL